MNDKIQHERTKGAITMIGTIAACLTTLASIPQVIKVIQTKNTEGISLGMYIMQVVGVFLWLLHGIIIQDLPLIVANAITFVLAATILGYKIRYK